MVVHGQIILNQFSNYPVESVRRSAFVSTLRERMQMVRHTKLYKSAAKPIRLRGVNRNPMKVRRPRWPSVLAARPAAPRAAGSAALARVLRWLVAAGRPPATKCDAAHSALAAPTCIPLCLCRRTAPRAHAPSP